MPPTDHLQTPCKVTVSLWLHVKRCHWILSTLCADVVTKGDFPKRSVRNDLLEHFQREWQLGIQRLILEIVELSEAFD